MKNITILFGERMVKKSITKRIIVPLLISFFITGCVSTEKKILLEKAVRGAEVRGREKAEIFLRQNDIFAEWCVRAMIAGHAAGVKDRLNREVYMGDLRDFDYQKHNPLFYPEPLTDLNTKRVLDTDQCYPRSYSRGYDGR